MVPRFRITPDHATNPIAIKRSLVHLVPKSLRASPPPLLPCYTVRERQDFPSLTMRFVTTFIRLALFALPVLASDDHDPHPTKCTEGAVLKGSYIVLLRDSASLDNVTGSIPHSNITAEWTIMKGFAATLTREDLKKLRARKDILSISKNAAAVARATQ